MRETVKQQKDAQFVISTHSPILLGYPEAQIISFDEGQLREIGYEETAPYQIAKRFVKDRKGLLDQLFEEGGSLFGKDKAG
jgi:predicted ATPase